MTYQHIHIVNPATGTEEHFRARITIDGIINWMVDRDRLRKVGVPDRPPDVDTEHLRDWVPWPGEEALPYFQRQLAWRAQHFDILKGQWADGENWVRWRLWGTMAGGFVSEVTTSAGPSGHLTREFGPEVPPDEVWGHIETLVMTIEGSTEWPEGQPSWVDYAEHAEEDLEYALAFSEARVGFGIPEARA